MLKFKLNINLKDNIIVRDDGVVYDNNTNYCLMYRLKDNVSGIVMYYLVKLDLLDYSITHLDLTSLDSRNVIQHTQSFIKQYERLMYNHIDKDRIKVINFKTDEIILELISQNDHHNL